jgi:hypothetical protein
MIIGALAFLTYVWHYLVARVIYDELVRPLAHGHAGAAPLAACVAAAAFLIGRATARSRP